jgi:hypothetical protein
MNDEQVSKLKVIRKNIWSITYATSMNILGIFSCHMEFFGDVSKCSLMKPKIFCHVDKGHV